MDQSAPPKSRASMVVKIAAAMLLGLAGLTVVGVDAAYAAAGPPTVTGLAAGLNETGTCVAGTGDSGDAAGGNEIAVCGTLLGTGANTTTTVTIGGIAATIVSITSQSRMYVTVPPMLTGIAAAKVIVKNTLLTTNTTSTCSAPGCVYTYTWQPPTISAVGLIPVTATSQTGSFVTVTAAGTWTAGQQVTLGGFTNHLTSGVNTISTGGSGSFVIPFAGSTNGSGTGVVSPTPAGGVGPVAGGTPVVIVGTDFDSASPVKFGGNSATSYTVNSPTQITAIAPAPTGDATGPVDVTVTNPNSTSATTPTTDSYTYIGVPTVTGVTTTSNPAGGLTGGGTQVTIGGTGFNNVSAVAFGSTPATSFLVNSLDSITAVAPAGTGTPDITVTTNLGTSATSSADHYAYNGSFAAAAGTASYSNSPGTTVPATGTTLR
jgi:hypothetical protein